MKTLFYTGISLLIIFEILKVFFIMPMPGSQEVNSIDLAYFLHKSRWFIRIGLALLIALGASQAFRNRKWVAISLTVVACVVLWMFNFKLVADKMFYQPNDLIMADTSSNQIPDHKLVIGITMDGISKAYPIQLIAYHHQVLDEIKDVPLMVTYCSVCRTGRIFEPQVSGAKETFRLVGMDHFNAMFEDETTGSWWRQVSGEAIAGPLKGSVLPELMSEQMTLAQWIGLHPETLIMQPDSAFIDEYESLEDYDFGIERGKLTMTDTLSWNDKSWVVGVVSGDSSYVVDWNELKRKRIINFHLDDRPMMVALAEDDLSFFAFERPSDQPFTIQNDTLIGDSVNYNLLGEAIGMEMSSLKGVNAYQEFWHSWNTFHADSKNAPRP